MKAPAFGPSLVLAALAAISLLVVPAVSAQIVTTTAGGHLGDGGVATQATLTFPFFTIQDSAGNIYISDAFAHRIRKIRQTASGNIISTIAGTGISDFSGDGGLARAAGISFPSGMAFDSLGNLIFADQGNNRIRKIDVTGVITTIAGTGAAGYSGDGGPALAATLHTPYGLIVDSGDNIYFTDINNFVVRRIDAGGVITTVAGDGTEGYGGDGGPAILAMLDFPRGLAFDTAHNLYIADTFNHRVRKVDTLGKITTFAGTGNIGYSGDGGPATEANIGNPRGLLLFGNQMLLSNGGGSRIRTVNLTTNIINTFAGSGSGYDGEGNPPSLARFDRTTGMLFTGGGLLVVDTSNGRLRRITPTSVTTLAGGFVGDNALATQAGFAQIENLTFDSAGNYYIVDNGASRIRKVDASGQINTVAGIGTNGNSGDGGPATQAELNLPYGAAVDRNGDLYIADTSNGVIRKVDPSGTITTFAADPNFFDLVSLAVDGSGNLYSADDAACVIRKITPGGSISIVAGVEFVCDFNGDGIPATSAYLNGEFGVAVDRNGNVYIGDTFNNRVRKVDRSGIISTIAGNGTCGFSGDGGSATLAMVCNPYGLGVDSRGNVYFGDYVNLRVRKVDRSGIIRTIAGTGNGGYNGENLPGVSSNFDGPVAIAIGPNNKVYVVDDGQNRVREIH